MHQEYQYLDTLKELLENGERVPNRTGVDTLRVLGVQHRYDFDKGFPLLTTKRVWMKGVTHELLWFLKGSTNIRYLVENGVNIWTDDAYRHYCNFMKKQDLTIYDKEKFVEDIISGRAVELGGYSLGELGPVYGKQWRNWGSVKIEVPGPGRSVDHKVEIVDQVANLVSSLKNNPSSRRHILSAWNVPEIDKMSLPPCHVMSQYTISKGKLWCQMYQRSCDTFLGVPFNIASYALLTHMLAQVCDLEPGGLIWSGHDVHVYENHISAVKEQLEREPKPFPKLVLNSEVDDIDKFAYDDIVIKGYSPHKSIKAELNT